MENNELAINKSEQAEFYKTVGERLRDQRKALKFTQEDIAFVLDISRVSVNNIENGKQRLPLHLIKAVADFLFIPLTVLVPDYTYKIRTISELKEAKIKAALDKINTKINNDPLYNKL